MPDNKCLFCSIANGDVPSYKIFEDNKYVAFLDIFPNIRGQTLVVPKEHYDSYIFDLNDLQISDFFIAVKRVAVLLETGLGVGRVNMVLEGTGVNHLHAKLYPAIGMKEKGFREVIAKDTIYFEKYSGYVTTLMGPKASEAELLALQREILK